MAPASMRLSAPVTVQVRKYGDPTVGGATLAVMLTMIEGSENLIITNLMDKSFNFEILGFSYYVCLDDIIIILLFTVTIAVFTSLPGPSRHVYIPA